MPSQWMEIATFGGGLDFSKNPGALREDQWTWCQNMRTENGSAVTAPRYYLALPAPPYPAPLTGKEIFGVLPNPFDPMVPLLLVAEDPTAYPRTVHFYLATAPAAAGQPFTATEILWDGAVAPVTHYDTRTAVQSAFFDGSLWITVGAGPAGYSVARWLNGGTTYSTLTAETQSTGASMFRCAHLESFGGHLVAASVGTSQAHERTIRYSDAGAGGGSIWLPANDNSADEGILDDSISGITALCPLSANALGIFTRTGLYAMAPTGNIPSFTRSWVGARGARDNDMHMPWQNPGPFVGSTPFGAAVMSYDNLYLPVDTAVGSPIFRAMEGNAQTFPRQPSECARLLWHPRWASLYAPQLTHGNSFWAVQPFYTYEAASQAWSQLFVPGGALAPARDHAMVFGGGQFVVGTNNIAPVHRHVILDITGQLWVERTQRDPADATVSFVDTRDIAMPVGTEIQRVKVQWEALSQDPTLPGADPTVQLEVMAAAREQMTAPPLFKPDGSFITMVHTEFVTAPPDARCTLNVGESDAPIRAHGKWIRLRFQSNGHMFRIRTVAVQIVDRAARGTSPNPSLGIPAPATRRPAEWDRADYDIGEWAGDGEDGPLGGGESGGEF